MNNEKTIFIKTKYKMRIFGIILLTISLLITSLYLKYRFMLLEIDSFTLATIDIGILIFFIYAILFGIRYLQINGYYHTYTLRNPIQLLVDDLNYSKILDLVNEYCSLYPFEKHELYLNDTGFDEYFTLYKNSESDFKIGVYYSNTYHAEYRCDGTALTPLKAIRLSKDKNINAKVSVYIHEFCGKKEHRYSMDANRFDSSYYLSVNPPIEICSIVIVVLPKRTEYKDFEWEFMSTDHEGHVLFVLLYEDKPDTLYIGPDVRLYSDNSYKHAIKELCKMLNIKYVDYDKLIQ